MSRKRASQSVDHVFLLMLENRSFAHMLGNSRISGTDASTGAYTTIQGLAGNESNSYKTAAYSVSPPGADPQMPVDPAHEFEDVVCQLCGEGAKYTNGRPYPKISNSGFVASYANPPSGYPGAPDNWGEVMKCFTSSQLPVLTALAHEFAVFDHWYSSMPGPTFPNRFFVHAASSGGLDRSPTKREIDTWGSTSGFSFENGTIFDELRKAGKAWRIYSDDGLPQVATLKGITIFDAVPYRNFAAEVKLPGYKWAYTMIEPNYGDHSTFVGGNSQHPLDGVANGEQLIKKTYEAIRGSPLWERSLLIITWDEHGGFFENDPPPSVIAPGDKIVMRGNINRNGFAFEQLGPRVPAIAISPWIRKNTIDHRTYDHASIPKTVEKIFGLSPMTKRDAGARSLDSLLTLASPRKNAPTTLPKPVVLKRAALGKQGLARLPQKPRMSESADTGNLPGFLYVALRAELALSPNSQRAEILATFKRIKTRGDAKQFFESVQKKIATTQAVAYPRSKR